MPIANRENDPMMPHYPNTKINRRPRMGAPGKGDDSAKVDSFETFSGKTTLHGLRFIGDHTSILPRRVFWLLLVLLCGVLFSIQMHDRVMYFLASPITVNIKVNYPEKAVFPAVTICNQNNFRISKAYDGDWLTFIHGFYDNKENPIPTLSRERLNTSVTELFVGLAHAKEDFVVKCKWANEECSAENFTTTLTSHGVCFTFNEVERPVDSLVVHASGVEHALQLTLNTENYESLKGPHDTRGIKMMVTDQSKVPRVEEIGLAISTGIHAFVGISVLTLSNLPPPYGECGEVPLLSTERYTKDACLTECETQYTYRKCGCRHFYMPDLTGEMAVCSIGQFLTCLQETQKTFNNVRRTFCTCPTSCFYHIYEPTVSYATSSHLKADIQDDVDENKVKKRYFASKEIASKTNAKQRDTFNTSLTNAMSSVKNMSWTILNNRVYTVENYNVMAALASEIGTAIEDMEAVYTLQMFVIKNNLIRGRDEMEEKTFRFVCQDYHGFIKEVQDKINHLVANNQDDASVAKVIKLFLQISLTNKQETLKRALENYTQLVDAYKQDMMILNNSYPEYDSTDLVAVKPNKLLKLLPEPMLVKEDIQGISDSITNIETYVAHLFNTKAITVNDNRVQTLSNDFQNACDSFMLKRILFYSDFIESPVKILEERIQLFDKLKSEFNSIKRELNDSFSILFKSITAARNDTIPFLLDALSYSMDYLNDKLPGVTKYDISNNNTVKKKLHDVKQFFESVDVRAVAIRDSWTSFRDKSLKVWEHIELTDDDVKKYYEHKGISNFIETIAENKAALSTNTERVWKDFDLRKIVGKTDIELLEFLQELFKELDEYSNDHNMDEEFYRRQFLQLDVFFKELRSEQINQQIGYDAIALLCDIGGATGLFIGGSLITVFEIVEFLLMCVVCRVCFRKAIPCGGK